MYEDFNYYQFALFSASTGSFTQTNIHKSRRERMVTNQIQLRGMDYEPTLNTMGTEFHTVECQSF